MKAAKKFGLEFLPPPAARAELNAHEWAF